METMTLTVVSLNNGDTGETVDVALLAEIEEDGTRYHIIACIDNGVPNFETIYAVEDRSTEDDISFVVLEDEEHAKRLIDGYIESLHAVHSAKGGES